MTQEQSYEDTRKRDSASDTEQSQHNNPEARDALKPEQSGDSITPGQRSEGQIERMQEHDASAARDRVGEASDASFPASDPPSW